MRVASLGKLLIAAQLHQRALTGAIDLEQDAGQYLSPLLRHPKFPERSITVRQLLTHTSSLRDPDEVYASRDGRAHRYGEAHSPGTYFRYANTRLNMLAQLMRTGALCSAHVACSPVCALVCVFFGTTFALSFALGASTP